MLWSEAQVMEKLLAKAKTGPTGTISNIDDKIQEERIVKRVDPNVAIS